MTKNFSVVLNVVLAIAVAVLYYLHFSGNSSSVETANATDSTSAAKPVVLAPKDIKGSKIVYVNMDVLQDGYDYIKEVNAAANRDLSSLESQYKKKGQKLQEDIMLFQQEAQGGQLSDNQIAAKEQELRRRNDELEALQGKSQQLMEEMQVRADEMNTTIKDYLKEYNKNTNYNFVMAYSAGPQSPVLIANDSLDITTEILDGLNAQYKASKGVKK